jgi:hypothetical protein
LTRDVETIGWHTRKKKEGELANAIRHAIYHRASLEKEEEKCRTQWTEFSVVDELKRHNRANVIAHEQAAAEARAFTAYTADET